jgi:hypothetical protein
MKKILIIALFLIQSFALFAKGSNTTYESPIFFIDYNTLDFTHNLTDIDTSEYLSKLNASIKLPIAKSIKNNNIRLGYLDFNNDLFEYNFQINYTLKLKIGAYNIKIDSPKSKTYYSGFITGIAIPIGVYTLMPTSSTYTSYFIGGWNYPTIDFILGRMVKTQVINLFGKTEDLSIAFILNNNLSYLDQNLIIKSTIGIELGVFF